MTRVHDSKYETMRSATFKAFASASIEGLNDPSVDVVGDSLLDLVSSVHELFGCLFQIFHCE